MFVIKHGSFIKVYIRATFCDTFFETFYNNKNFSLLRKAQTSKAKNVFILHFCAFNIRKLKINIVEEKQRRI